MNALATYPTARRPRRGGGFSLVELLAVMVIMAVLAAVAAPTLSNLDTTRGNMGVNQLLRDLSYARQYALATGTTTWVEFDEAGESYELLVEDTSNPGKANALTLRDPATGRDYIQTLNTDSLVGVEIISATFDSGDDVGFDWLGQPLNDTGAELSAATGSVTLTGSNTVTIVKTTGYIYSS